MGSGQGGEDRFSYVETVSQFCRAVSERICSSGMSCDRQARHPFLQACTLRPIEFSRQMTNLPVRMPVDDESRTLCTIVGKVRSVGPGCIRRDTARIAARQVGRFLFDQFFNSVREP